MPELLEKYRYSHGVRIPLPMAAARFVATGILPAPALRVSRNLYYRYLRHRIRNARVAHPIALRMDYKVQGGPFTGLRYPEAMVRADIESPFMPKLLGCYEMECNPFIEQISCLPQALVINIGASEGYYAVGLAMRIHDARVLAYEAAPGSQELCRQLAQLNGVQDKVDVRGFCDRPALAAALKTSPDKPAVVLCDCEGGELDLLQPDLIPALRHAILLVELHDFVQDGLSDIIKDRFQETHEISSVYSHPRNPDSYPALASLPPDQRAFFVSEHRTCRMEWMFAVPRERHDAPL